MSLPVTIPNTFANATSAIPLSQLDTNFSTLANVINDINSGAQVLANLKASNVEITGGIISNVTLDNVTVDVETLSNVTINGGNVTVTNMVATTANATTGNITTVNATTVDTTNIEVTNIKAKDGTAAIVLTDSTGAATISSALTANGGVVFNENGANVDFRVEGDTEPNLLFVDASADAVGIGTTDMYGRINVQRDISDQYSTISLGDFVTASNSVGIYGRVTSGGVFGISTAGAPIAFFNGGSGLTEVMRIDSSGNLGLGVTPSAWTIRAMQIVNGSVYGAGNETGYYANAFYDGAWKYIASSNASGYLQNAGTHQWFTAPSGTAGNAITFTQAMTLDASGNLGIGVTSPSYPLDIADSSNGIRLGGATAGANYRIYRPATGGDAGLLTFYGGQSGFTGYIFGGVDGERARITSGGDFGIGTTSPVGRLSVASASSAGSSVNAWSNTHSVFGPNAGSSTGSALGLGYNNTANQSEIVSLAPNVAWRPLNIFSGGIIFSASSGVESMRIDTSGNVLIGGTASPASATKSLALFNGVVPTGSVTDGCVLYTEDVSSSSELKVRDEAGNVTTLSPHNFSMIPEGPSEDMAWAYYSERNGKKINVDMLKLARMVEKLTGEKLVYTD